MTGMLQIITYLLGVYLIMKGAEILQIALASPRENRTGIIAFGIICLLVSIGAALTFITLQDQQASSVSSSMPTLPY